MIPLDDVTAWLRTVPQYLLPQHALSRLVHRLTRFRWQPWKRLLIERFVHHFHVDMTDAVQPNLESYPDFNSFFTRTLRPGARPLAKDKRLIISPVDGRVSQAGKIDDNTLIQAKGHFFTVTALLGDHPTHARSFVNGHYTTIYLSPRDYHRIHMPIRGKLRAMTHIPGRLFAVNDSAVKIVPELFSRNERVVLMFDTELGPMAMILVGALFVGSIETVWAGEVTPPTRFLPHTRNYQGAENSELVFDRGVEIARFNMGSTVILLFSPNVITWEKGIEPQAVLRMGQSLARRV